MRQRRGNSNADLRDSLRTCCREGGGEESRGEETPVTPGAAPDLVFGRGDLYAAQGSEGTPMYLGGYRAQQREGKRRRTPLEVRHRKAASPEEGRRKIRHFFGPVRQVGGAGSPLWSVCRAEEVRLIMLISVLAFGGFVQFLHRVRPGENLLVRRLVFTLWPWEVRTEEKMNLDKHSVRGLSLLRPSGVAFRSR